MLFDRTLGLLVLALFLCLLCLGLVLPLHYCRDDPGALVIGLRLGPAALQVRPELWVLFVAHHARFALTVQLLDVV